MALDENPGIAAPRPEYGSGVRLLPHGRYLIFYSVSASGVLVERILHGVREIGGLFEDWRSLVAQQQSVDLGPTPT